MRKDDLTAIFGSMAGMARAICEGETTVRNWFGRGSIPPKYDAKIMKAARDAGRPITPDDLHQVRCEMISHRREEPARAST